MTKIAIKIKLLSERISIPKFATAGSAGFDFQADIPEDIILSPGERCLIPTGLAIAIPEGYEVQIRPRSGLAFKNGVTVLNTPGTIDSDYRGPIRVLLINSGTDPFTVMPGMRIAQGVISVVPSCEFLVVDSLDNTARGEGGFGSTGAGQ